MVWAYQFNLFELNINRTVKIHICNGTVIRLANEKIPENWREGRTLNLETTKFDLQKHITGGTASCVEGVGVNWLHEENLENR